jgi:hypothetical protein
MFRHFIAEYLKYSGQRTDKRQWEVTIMFKTIRFYLFLLIAASFVSSTLHAKKVKKSKSNKVTSQKRLSKKNKSRQKKRELSIMREKSYSKDSRRIDFSAEDISGSRKAPSSSIISRANSDKAFDLIKIRTHWKPEMIQSTSSIEVGR